MIDEVDVIWESSKHRRQDRRPRTPTPPGRRPRTPSPPRQMRPSPPSRARSTSSPPVAVTDLPEKVYSCVSVISLFDKSSQAGVVELQGSNGQRAYCFFLAKVSICYRESVDLIVKMTNIFAARCNKIHHKVVLPVTNW